MMHGVVADRDSVRKQTNIRLLRTSRVLTVITIQVMRCHITIGIVAD